MTGRGAALACAALLALLGSACQETASKTEAGGSAAPAAKPSAGDAAPPATPTPAPIAVADIPAQAEAFDALRREINAHLLPGPELEDSEAEIRKFEGRAGRILQRPALSGTEEVQVVELQELETDARDLNSTGARLEEALAIRARTLDTDLTTLVTEQARWAVTLPEAAEHDAPEAIRDRGSETVVAIEALRKEVKLRRDEALTQLDKVSRFRSALDTARADIGDRRRVAQKRLFAVAEGPIWDTKWTGRSIGRAARETLSRDWRRLTQYVRDHGASGLLKLGIFFFAGLVMLFLLKAPAKQAARNDPYARGPVVMIERPLAAATLAAILLLIWTTPSPSAPSLTWDIAWMLLILSTAILLRKLLGPPVRRTLYVLTAAASLVPLRYLYEQDPLLDRVVLILQSAAVATTLVADLARKSWDPVFTLRFWRRLARATMVVALVLLATALVLVVIGYVGTARLLRTGAIGTLGLGLISLGGYSLLYGFASTLIETRALRTLKVIQHNPEAIRRFLRHALGALVGLSWVLWSLTAFGLNDEARQLLGDLLKAKFQLGSATISVSAILTFVGVLAGTFLLSALVRFLLEGEVFPRLQLPRGLPFTISTTVRYAIIFSGFALALGAAGIDLSRVTLLAGALGVGIGFGLQNLVSNFVSGLILLFERPVQVGDYVDVGSLVGEVRRIGMRSSTVLTAEGAEVVVPNADLIS
ncbi:MAG TPA: mechanosensitive ion channel domain-containing protein, partial [Thermoanaerobaculia bacterium]